MSLFMFDDNQRSAVIDSVCTALLTLELPRANREVLQSALDELCGTDIDALTAILDMSESLTKNGHV